MKEIEISTKLILTIIAIAIVIIVVLVLFRETLMDSIMGAYFFITNSFMVN